MVDHESVRITVRGRLLSLAVCSTGLTALSATATGYARTAGSFRADGFVAGMEVTPAGFPVSDVGLITYVSDRELRIAGGRKVQAAADNRSLTVSLPLVRSWEMMPVTEGSVPTADGEVVRGRPYIDEQYLPGPATLGGIGPNARHIASPTYLPRVFVPEGYGSAAASKYADAILALYPPTDVIPLNVTQSIRIRGDVAPFPGQSLPDGRGCAGILCTVPLRCFSLNTI